MLRFTHTAGIAELAPGPPDADARSSRSGSGMFGKAVADRRVVVTGDYVADDAVRPRRHDRLGSSTRSASARWSSRRWPPATRCSARWARSRTTVDAFTAPQIALVRALSDHAALAMANARLIEELARSREAIERQRLHRALAARARHPDLRRPRPRRGRPAHDRRGAPAARRRRGADRHRRPRGPPAARHVLGGRGADPRDRVAATTPTTGSRSARPAGPSTTGQTYISRDYLTDEQPRPRPRAGHVRAQQGHPRRHRHAAVRRPGPVRGDHRVVDAGRTRSTPERRRPARDDRRPVGGRARPRAADRGAGPLTRGARPARRGGARAARDRRRGWARMGEDPGDVLNRIVHETARLLGGERARLDLLEPLSGSWLWTYPPRRRRSTTGSWRRSSSAAADDGRPTGLAGLAIREGRPVASRRLHARRAVPPLHGGRPGRPATSDLHSIVAAPVIGEEGLLGVLQAGHRAVRRVRRGRHCA